MTCGGSRRGSFAPIWLVPLISLELYFLSDLPMDEVAIRLASPIAVVQAILAAQSGLLLLFLAVLDADKLLQDASKPSSHSDQ